MVGAFSMKQKPFFIFLKVLILYLFIFDHVKIWLFLTLDIVNSPSYAHFYPEKNNESSCPVTSSQPPKKKAPSIVVQETFDF